MAGGRGRAQDYRALELVAHELLADAPLHDVWCLDLPGGGPGRSMLDLRALLARQPLERTNPQVRGLFALRRGIGRAFGWEGRESSGAPPPESYLQLLSDAQRAASRVEPGRPEGPFRTLYVSERESIAEVRNATVHAFLVYALFPRETAEGYRMWWAVYVKPVGRLTPVYMAAIDPFRRWIIYPALLGQIERSWRREFGAGADAAGGAGST